MSKVTEVTLKLTTQASTAALNGFRREFTGFTSSLGNFYSQLNGLSGAAKLVGLAGGVTGFRAFASEAMSLERAMLSVKANIMSGTGSAKELQAQLSEVRDTARELSKATILSDTDNVNIINQLLKTGANLSDVRGTRGAAFGTAALAQLGGLSPEAAAEQMGKMGNAFSFRSGGQYYDLAEQIIKVDDASAAKSADLLYNAQQSSASAAQLGINPKRMISALGYLDSLGNMAGTSFNRFLEGLAAATPQRKKALASSGMRFWETGADGKEHLKDIGTVINTVRAKFSGLKSDREKIILGHKLFGEEGGRAAAFFSSKAQSFEEFEAKVAQSSGSAEKLRVHMEGLSASLDRLKNSTFSALEGNAGSVRKTSSWLVNKVSDGIDAGHGGEMLAAAAGLAIAGRLAYKATKKGIAGSMGDAAGAIGAQKVFVTNWPGSLGGAGGGAPGGIPTTGGIPDKNGKPIPSTIPGTIPTTPRGPTLAQKFTSGAGSTLKIGGALALVSGGIQAASIASDDSLSAAQKNTEYAKTIAGTGGALAGSVIGGGIGTLFGGFGAVPGALIGGAIGEAIGKWLIADDAKVGATKNAGADAETQRQQLAAIEQMANRPVQVQLQVNGQVLADSVNRVNGTSSRRQ